MKLALLNDKAHFAELCRELKLDELKKKNKNIFNN